MSNGDSGVLNRARPCPIVKSIHPFITVPPSVRQVSKLSKANALQRGGHTLVDTEASNTKQLFGICRAYPIRRSAVTGESDCDLLSVGSRRQFDDHRKDLKHGEVLFRRDLLSVLRKMRLMDAEGPLDANIASRGTWKTPQNAVPTAPSRIIVNAFYTQKT